MIGKAVTIIGGICLIMIGLMPLPSPGAEANDTLNAKQRAIVPIAAFTAMGDLDSLKPALNDGLDAGLTINEIKEVLVQMYAYAGFPRSLNGLGTFIEVLDERAGHGIKDEVGRNASPFPPDKSRLELGTEIQTYLVGRPVEGRVFTFAPAIDAFLKDHLFGDIFGRDILDFQTREAATIAALASMKGVEGQLQSHIGVALNVGVTAPEIGSLISTLEAKVGRTESETARLALMKVLAGRNK